MTDFDVINLSLDNIDMSAEPQGTTDKIAALKTSTRDCVNKRAS